MTDSNRTSIADLQQRAKAFRDNLKYLNEELEDAEAEVARLRGLIAGTEGFLVDTERLTAEREIAEQDATGTHVRVRHRPPTSQ